MSKLLVAVVHDLDADQVISALEDEGHRVTRIPSIGGYLRLGNSTLLIGVEDEVMAGFWRSSSESAPVVRSSFPSFSSVG